MKHYSFFMLKPYTSRQKILLLLLAASYLAGIIGLQVPLTMPLFQALTPFNLLLSAGILFSFHNNWNRPFILFCIICFLSGFLIEVIGVASGLVFGHYHYGPTLGYQLWGVPLIIGLNWLMLIYSTGIICEKLQAPLVIKAAFASALMLLLDIFIEPVAIAFNFWQWQDDHIPLQNYAAWFIVSFCLHLLFYLLPFHRRNPAAKFLYLLQLIFFIILCLFTIY
jgi:uncharacterized membrane protein